MSTNTTTTKPHTNPASFHAIGQRLYYVQYVFEPDSACYVSSGIKLFSTYEDAVDWVHSQKRLRHAGISDIRVEVRQ